MIDRTFLRRWYGVSWTLGWVMWPVFSSFSLYAEPWKRFPASSFIFITQTRQWPCLSRRALHYFKSTRAAIKNQNRSASPLRHQIKQTCHTKMNASFSNTWQPPSAKPLRPRIGLCYTRLLQPCLPFCITGVPVPKTCSSSQHLIWGNPESMSL